MDVVQVLVAASLFSLLVLCSNKTRTKEFTDPADSIFPRSVPYVTNLSHRQNEEVAPSNGSFVM